MPSPLGVPIQLFHECAGHKITVELTNGEMYRGLMREAEDNMNCQLQAVTATAKDGSITKLEYVFIRGSKIRLVILPDMLRNAPMFKRFDPKQAKLLKKTQPPPGTQHGRGNNANTNTTTNTGGRGAGRGRDSTTSERGRGRPRPY